MIADLRNRIDEECAVGWGKLLVVAHPFTETGVLPVAPVVLAILGTCVALGVASIGAPPQPGQPPRARTDGGPLPPVDVALRVVAIVLLGLLLAASRLGPSAATANLAPMLLVLVGWPLAVVASVALGPIWRRVDPLDGLARAARAPVDAVGPEAAVWPAAPVALLLAGAAVVLAASARPAGFGTAVALYVLATVAGCLALGRRTWLERVEPVGLVLTWTGYLRGGRLSAWQPPPGAAAVLGAVAGALLFGLLRRTDVWAPVAFQLGPRPADVLGVVSLGVVTAAVLVLLERALAGGGRGGAVAAGVVPVVAALTVALWLAGGRLLIAARLVPHLLVDPFGRGWTLGGLGGVSAAPSPLDPVVVVWLQVVVLHVGAIAGVRAVRGHLDGRTAMTGGASGAALLLAVGVLLVSAH